MRQESTIKRTAFTTSREPKNRVETPVEPKPIVKAEPQHKVSTLQKIQEKAYDLYLKRNGGPGSAEQDWAEAERIVKGL